jgi:hypothetical protein
MSTIASNKTITKTLNVIKEAEAKIKDNMLIGLSYKLCPIQGILFDFTIDTKQDDWLNALSLAECIAEEIKEFDYPVSTLEAEKFCKFMEFDEEETATVLASCATIDQYQAFVDSMRRNYIY